MSSFFLQSLFARARVDAVARAAVAYGSVRRGTELEPFLFVPLTATDEGGGRFELPAGSIWISSRLFTSAAPAGAYSGIQITGGEMQLPGVGFLGPGQLHVAASAVCTLDLELAAGGPHPGIARLTIGPATLSVDASDTTVSFLGSDPTALSATGGAPAWDATWSRVRIPYAATSTGVTIDHDGRLSALDGTAAVTSAAWLWQTRTAPLPDEDAEDAGAIAVDTERGLSAAWDGLEAGPIAIGPATILLQGATVAVLASRAEQRQALHRLTLPHDSSIELHLERPFTFGALFQSAGFEVLQFEATVVPSLARPLDVSGSRVDYRARSAMVAFSDGAFGRSVNITSELRDPPKRFFALALENALLSVTPVRSFRAELNVTNPTTVTDGSIDLVFGLCHVLPTLPDPYAANFTPRRFDAPRTTLDVRVKWTATDAPALELRIPESGGEPPDYLPMAPNLLHRSRLWSEFNRALGRQARGDLKLLDVSTNAGQFGVATTLGTPRFDDVRVIAAGVDVHVFTVPQVQWEPVRTVQAPGVAQPPAEAFSRDDGDETQIGVRTVRLVPVEPRAAARELLDAYTTEGAQLGAIFTLPFGMQAMTGIDPQRMRIDVLPAATPTEIAFDGFASPLFIRLESGYPPPDEVPAQSTPRFLPGFTEQHANIPAPPFPGGVATSVLDPLRPDFNAIFAPGGQKPQVPITHIDLSGFGASTNTKWVDDVEEGVSQVAFTIANGRTAREVVQFRTIVLPCLATFVRTFTLERTSAGFVIRRDSGWQATTPGLYQRAGNPIGFHKGAVRGLFNIREIDETDEFVTAGGKNLQAVYFDADAAIDDVVSGANGAGLVPALRQKGYILRPTTTTTPGPVTPADLTDLFLQVGPVGGPINCEINVGGSGQRMRLHGLHGRHGAAGAFFVMLSGAPIWTKASGEWSVARLHTGGARQGETEPIDRVRGVPLVRPDGGNWRIADPGEGMVSYALLNASKTHRVLFPAPEIQPGQQAFSSAQPPLVADPYAMVSSAGPFPKASEAIAFPNAAYSLEIVGGGLRLAYPPFTVQRGRDLIKTGSWSLRNEYGHDGATRIEIKIDPDAIVDAANRATWPVKMDDVGLVLDVPPLGELLRITSEAPSLGSLPGHMPKPKIELGPTLDALKQIVSVLDDMQLPGGLELSVNAAPVDAQTFRIAIALLLRLATRNGDRVDVGVGKLMGELKVSAELEAGLSATRGRVMLEVYGDLQQGILPPLLYAGGVLRFIIGIDQSGKPDWRLDIGTVASIGGNLIPGLVEVEGTVHYAYMLRPDLSPGVRIGMQARAKVLSGLVGIKFGVDAGVTVMRPPGDVDKLRLLGDVHVHGSVTVAWVLEPDFSRTMRFEQDVHVRYAALGMITGLLPVPL